MHPCRYYMWALLQLLAPKRAVEDAEKFVLSLIVAISVSLL